MTTRQELLQTLDGLLQPGLYKDYAPNGLQVEGRAHIGKLVTGVSASLAFIEAAIAAKADAVLVHHGLFWRGHDGRLTGWMKQRVARLLAHDINLFAYHLPLDAHASLGNNARLGQLLGWRADGHFGEQDLGWVGEPGPGQVFDDGFALAAHVRDRLGREVLTVAPAVARPVRRVAWCSGGAQGYFEAAIAAGADAFVTGEISEPQTHLARECGVAFLACGHHASERLGAPAVGAHVAAQLGLAHEFIDIDNPA